MIIIYFTVIESIVLYLLLVIGVAMFNMYHTLYTQAKKTQVYKLR